MPGFIEMTQLHKLSPDKVRMGLAELLMCGPDLQLTSSPYKTVKPDETHQPCFFLK
jgi:hypothetical protein